MGLAELVEQVPVEDEGVAHRQLGDRVRVDAVEPGQRLGDVRREPRASRCELLGAQDDRGVGHPRQAVDEHELAQRLGRAVVAAAEDHRRCGHPRSAGGADHGGLGPLADLAGDAAAALALQEQGGVLGSRGDAPGRP